ncbi:MAG: DNA polymerase III subunit gamma/tau [Deltaproteobacteria bacterium]|nr:DNA polymerase III subunit gamma/tau [Deltaproteobacteria bacterium]
MTYEVLARKWRPRRFEDVVGQEHVTQTLINAIKADRLSHAYLFAGPRGVGKTSVARILAKAINCVAGEPGQPCGQCQSCREITDGSSMDVQEIDGASNRGIDEIRDLRESIKYMPAANRYRVYIIDEVHMLTLQAFNALLKTLEEPPAHVKFIFATTESHKVPVTILSRCQRFDFKRIPIVKIIAHLEHVTAEEDVRVSPSGLMLLARQADGSMRDAESLLDQVVSFSGSEVTDEHIVEILGIIDRDLVFQSSRAVIEGSAAKCLEIVERIYHFGHDIKEFYRALMEQFRNLLVSLISSDKYLLDMTEEDLKELKAQAGLAGQEKLQILLNFLITREESLRFTTHPRVLLEATMIKLCRIGEFASFGELLAKLEDMDKRLGDSPPGACRAERSDLVSEPGARWEKAADASPPVEAPTEPEDAPGDWEGFLDFLSENANGMVNVLREWTFQGLQGETLEIARGDQPFSSTYFDDKERHGRLTDYCRDYFGKDIQLKIVDGKPGQPKKGAPKTAPAEPVETENSELPHQVQELIQTFQGEIR